MNKVVEILIRRDEITEDEANTILNDARRMMENVIMIQKNVKTLCIVNLV